VYSGISRNIGLTKGIITRRRITSAFDFTSNSVTDEARSYDSLSVLVGSANASYLMFTDRYVDANSDILAGNRPLTENDALKVLYGFGDVYGIKTTGGYGSGIQGTNYLPSFSTADNRASDAVVAPTIRGWRHGLISGIATNTKMYWRRSRYGQVRDMLEQRPNTKFLSNKRVTSSPITVRFVHESGFLTAPEETWSSNLSFEATSSMPYFDGYSRNRDDINTRKLNQGIVSFTNDNGNLTL
jgi:hypothetical protein